MPGQVLNPNKRSAASEKPVAGQTTEIGKAAPGVPKNLPNSAL